MDPPSSPWLPPGSPLDVCAWRLQDCLRPGDHLRPVSSGRWPRLPSDLCKMLRPPHQGRRPTMALLLHRSDASRRLAAPRTPWFSGASRGTCPHLGRRRQGSQAAASEQPRAQRVQCRGHPGLPSRSFQARPLPSSPGTAAPIGPTSLFPRPGSSRAFPQFSFMAVVPEVSAD